MEKTLAFQCDFIVLHGAEGQGNSIKLIFYLQSTVALEN